MKTKASIVGRYETSNITEANGTAIKVVAGATPSNYIEWYYMYAQQKDYATNKGLASVGSTMIQGAAYDQVMKYVNDTTKYNVQSTGYALHNRSYSDGPWQTAGLNYTDKTQYKDVAKNIYDLEGNVVAWTTEASNTDGRGELPFPNTIFFDISTFSGNNFKFAEHFCRTFKLKYT